MKTIYIYALKDPDSKNIRYVGKTVNLIKRFRRHLRNGKDITHKYHSAIWIRSLLNNNKIPEISIIEEVSENNWEEREIYWIKYYRQLYDLTNILEGGKDTTTYGRLGKHNSDEHKLKCSIARTGVKINQNDNNGNRKKAINAYFDKIKKHILQYSMEGEFIKEWESAVAASKFYNLSSSTSILTCAKNNTNEISCIKYMWRFKINNTIIFKIDKYKKRKK